MICPISNQTPGEERLNTLTHGVGLALSLIGLAVLIDGGTQRDTVHQVAAIVYGLSLVQLFAASCLYHLCQSSPLKLRCRILDHCAIYVLIAGSYTPFLVVSLGGWRGWSLLVAVWCMAFLGVRSKFKNGRPLGGVRSVLGYLAMGWCVLLVFPQLKEALAPQAVRWLVAGGAAYTLGVPFYAWRRLPYSHGIWHLFVLAGAACHYVAVVFHVL